VAKKKKVLKSKEKKKSSKVKKSSKEKGIKISKSEASILKALKKEFEVVSNKKGDLVPYLINFIHKGLQFITGGVPGGIFMEAHGPSQCGKSYLMMELGAACIKAGGWYLQADIERAYKRMIGKKLGLEGNPRFVKTKERNMEKLWKKMMKFVLKIRKYDPDCPIFIGVDSFNPLQINKTMKELEKELKEMSDKEGKVEPKDVKGYAAMTKNARFSDLMRDFIQFIEEHKVTFLLLNQQRTKHGLMFGDKRTTNADDIIQFYASLRLRGSLGSKLKPNKDSKKIIGRQVYWETVKSRHPDIPPFMKTMTEIIYREGIRPYSGLAELLDTEEVIKLTKITVPAKQKGKTKQIKGFIHEGKKIPLDKFEEYVDQHPEILEIKE
jgi:RecA/RadA recombinase